jgi:hypothetical protein
MQDGIMIVSLVSHIIVNEKNEFQKQRLQKERKMKTFSFLVLLKLVACMEKIFLSCEGDFLNELENA